MSQPQPNELSHEARSHHRMEVVYGRKIRERQIFMEDLKDYRKRKDKLLVKEIKESMGTRWYQALSVPQIRALDNLEFSIYQDMLEARPTRTQTVIKAFGILPRPRHDDLMHCIFYGRDDPKEMLAQLFLIKYNHPFNIRRRNYDLNARLLLSGILYLGMPQLIKLLREQFQPDEPEPPPAPKKKVKPRQPLASPYLEKMVAVLYEPRQLIRKLPPPLPNLDSLNEPLEETPPVPKPPPPPPPPPPPKKRLPQSYCDKLAGIIRIEPYTSLTNVEQRALMQSRLSRQTIKVFRRLRKSKYFTEQKKKYGIGNTRKSVTLRRRKPKVPISGLWNAQYTICGVTKVAGRVVFILGNVTILPLAGDIIHGGHAVVTGEYINIHCGVRGQVPPPASESCGCAKLYTDSVLKYIKGSKCYCGHHYDFYNEGTFAPDDLPFFEKPTRHRPLQINYDTIYDMDEKNLHLGKEFKRVWDTDSVIHVDNDEEYQKKKPLKKKKRSSKTCLGLKPKPEDYLRCALHRLRRINLAARLPDIHMVPELAAWMCRRLYGPYTREQKNRLIYKSNVYWTLYSRYAGQGIPHISVPKEPTFEGHTTWKYKQLLSDKFKKFTNKYRLEMFRSHADYTNMMWPSMFQAQVPDKKFREIYFSYLMGNIENLSLMHPYSTTETESRYISALKRKYRCLPAGVEN